MMFACDLCAIKVSSPVLLQAHYGGKKHLRNVEHKNKLQTIADRSVFLSKFHHNADVSAIEETLRKFGEVDRVIVDKQNTSHAIVEFKDADVAKSLIESQKKLQVGNDIVDIHARRIEFNQKLEIRELNSTEIVDYLNSLHKKDPEFQVDGLISQFAMTSEMALKREKFANDLQVFLQKFFSTEVRVHCFGSSTTGLGFVNSDLDMTFIFDDGSLGSCQTGCSSPNEPQSKKSDSLLATDVQSLLSSPVSKQAFLTLSKQDKARLLNRIVNVYRKETNNIMNLVPILDAKCPVVRFALRRPFVLCELSIQNILGEVKANFVKRVVDADISGTLRRFLIVVKLWANCANLFAVDEAQPRTNWNSYTLSLLAVSFLQSLKIVRPPNMKADSRIVQGWMIDYEIERFDLSAHSIMSLLKGFTNFLYNNVQDEKVHCIRDGIVYSTKTDFMKRFTDEDGSKVLENFKFGLANVQDPIELTHNVAANVSKTYISLLRQRIMFTIAALKNNSDDLIPIFELEAFKQQWCTATKDPKKRDQVISIDIDSNDSAYDIVSNFTHVFKEVLLLEEVQEPSSKRIRLSLDHQSMEVQSVEYRLQFVAKFPVSLELKDKSEHPINVGFVLLLFFEEYQVHCLFEFDGQTISQDIFHFFVTFLPRYLSHSAARFQSFKSRIKAPSHPIQTDEKENDNGDSSPMEVD
ncbi:speckle targeted PIP5K1A-regulated poly(A) polymerase [Ditylenchus destructor]|uniref:Speckle targeted PIP5K1A-regulated poly(A) polymerase n=1 Tax=Ditylenchus destructor TaxID=166010 RepID=A0AAD4MZB3_9BILA|nr:speckle targeted PIP5K1A-regulated poly(A) polymerase [Ditylenchus destructor]